jgi:hypothetical protein
MAFFIRSAITPQMALSIDNQPITDQQGSLFSTQIPLNAIQSIEAVYGGTPAE